jgi:hypothetical protein
MQLTILITVTTPDHRCVAFAPQNAVLIALAVGKLRVSRQRTGMAHNATDWDCRRCFGVARLDRRMGVDGDNAKDGDSRRSRGDSPADAQVQHRA